jgi:hypothetical protein
MRRAAIVFSFVVFAACVSPEDSTGPVTTDIAGSYSLRSINGQALPFLLGVNGSDTLSLVDDTYTLTGDARFTEIFHTRRVQSGTTVLVAGSDSGSFTRSGQSLKMVGLNGVFTATIKSDTLQLDGENTTFVYRK